jgi:hypothetical protein
VSARDRIQETLNTADVAEAQLYATIAIAEALVEQTEARNAAVPTAPTVEIGWAQIELMGHRREAGFVTEVEVAGRKFIRLDIPAVDAPPTTHYYAPGAIYGIHPTTELSARGFAGALTPDELAELPF